LRWLIPLRWGITFTGMAIASGRGVYLGVCAVGLWALISGLAPALPISTVLAMAVGGGLVGAVYGLLPRRRDGRRVRSSSRRVGLCALAGVLTAPLFAEFGQLPPAASDAMGLVLLVGVASMVAYMVRKRQRGIAALRDRRASVSS
jgi:hypothetical protein